MVFHGSISPKTGDLVLHARDAGRVLLGHNRSRGFRTPPAYGERRPFQFALFSCHMPYKQSGLFGKRTEVHNLEMWDFLGASLRRHGHEVDLIIAGGDQCYTDGVPTLDIWRYLNRRMRKEGETLLPDEASITRPPGTVSSTTPFNGGDARTTYWTAAASGTSIARASASWAASSSIDSRAG